MKFLLGLMVFIAAVAIAVVSVGFVLPAQFRVERSTTINAVPEKIYGLLQDPKAWPRWTVWNKRDPAMQVTFSGAATGVGASWSWDSKTEGKGTMVFTKADPPKRLDFKLTFPDMNMVATGYLALAADGGATKVTWVDEGELGGNPLVRYFGLFADRMIGPDFEGGLAGLKALAEQP